MKRTSCTLVGIIVFAAGCGNLSGVLNTVGLSPTNVTLRMVNETAFEVEPNVYVSSIVGGLLFDQITKEVLTIGINLQNFSNLVPGEVKTQRYDCDAIKAVMASDAQLKTGLGFSPNDDSEVFVAGDDFECGDTLTIRYTGGLTGFNARIDAAPFDPLALVELLVGP